MPDRKDEFLQKLHALLEEYDVSIGVTYEGDTHGVYDERVTIDHRVSKRSYKEETWLRLDYQTYLGADDLKEYAKAPEPSSGTQGAPDAS